MAKSQVFFHTHKKIYNSYIICYTVCILYVPQNGAIKIYKKNNLIWLRKIKKLWLSKGGDKIIKKIDVF